MAEAFEDAGGDADNDIRADVPSQAGHMARVFLQPYDSNPYRRGTVAHREWAQGWNDEDDRFQEWADPKSWIDEGSMINVAGRAKKKAG